MQHIILKFIFCIIYILIYAYALSTNISLVKFYFQIETKIFTNNTEVRNILRFYYLL